MADASRRAEHYDGCSSQALARLLDLPLVEIFEVVPSTQDIAHAMAAAGTPGGTLILANAQTSGRGRRGRTWTSDAGQGIWLTMVERPADSRSLDVLSIRIGLLVAEVLDDPGGARIGLKWPNDLYRGHGKLGGILLESRWQNARLGWVSIGLGLNVKPPARETGAIGLAREISRVDLLARVIPAIRAAARLTGHLSPLELDAFGARDVALGRRVQAPRSGIVAGIDASGALLIDTPQGRELTRVGTLEFEEAL